MSVIVFGSINLDLAAYVPRLPKPGETLFGQSFITTPGGKGANQAVAAARLGTPVRMIGRVGKDSYGRDLLDALGNEGIDLGGIKVDSHQTTGIAIIAVDKRGENTIIVISGANMAVDDQDVRRCVESLEGARVLMLQLEVPIEANLEVARQARRRGVTVILDPAPSRSLPEELYPFLDVITPNELEVEPLAGHAVRTKDDVHRAAASLRARGVGSVVIKMGSQGAYYATESGGGMVPPFPVSAVDTVAAGDAFNGGPAVGLVEGLEFPEALLWASAAGALAATREGAQPSLPRRAELIQLLKHTGEG